MTRLLHFNFFLFLSLSTAVQVNAQGRGYYDQIYEFSNGTNVADILVLCNDSLLLTLYTEPTLYRLDPWLLYKPPVLVQRFSKATSLLGITQINRTTIAVIAEKTDFDMYNLKAGVPDSFSVYLLGLSGRVAATFPISEASFLKNVTKLPYLRNVLLISDFGLSVVWRLNTITEHIDQPFDQKFETLNGLHVFRNYLYLNPTGFNYIRRYRINNDGSLAGIQYQDDNLGIKIPWMREFVVKQSKVKGNTDIFMTAPYNEALIQVSTTFSSPGNVFKAILSNSPYDGDDLDPMALAFANPSSQCNILYAVLWGNYGSLIWKVNLDRVPNDLFVAYPSQYDGDTGEQKLVDGKLEYNSEQVECIEAPGSRFSCDVSPDGLGVSKGEDDDD